MAKTAQLPPRLRESAMRNPTAGAGGVGYGYRASLLPDVCWVYQDAMVAGKLLASQRRMGETARAFLKALTNKAIEDLVDQATGFDLIRKRKAIDQIIEQYVPKEAQPWVRIFDIDFYRHVFRLNKWPFDPENSARPSVIGHWTNDIYDRLVPGVRDAMHERVKRNEKGRPTQKLTRWLTKEVGKPRLRELLEGLKLLMRMSQMWPEFMQKLDEFYPKFGNTLQLPFNSSGYGALTAISSSNDHALPSEQSPPATPA